MTKPLSTSPRRDALRIAADSLASVERIEGDEEKAKIWLSGPVSLAVEATREQDGWKIGVLGPGLGMMTIMGGMSDKARARADATLLEKIVKLTGKPADQFWDPPPR